MPAAAMGWIAPTVLGGLGLLSQHEQNRKANRAAGDANATLANNEARRQELFEMMYKFVQDARAKGEFDPKVRLAQLDASTKHYQDEDRNNLAGSMRIAGYRPGDSEIGTRIDAQDNKYRFQREQLANQVYNGAFDRELSAIKSIDPSQLDTSSALALQQRQYAESQMVNPAGFMNSLMPFIEKAFTKTPSASVNYAAQPGRFNLPVNYGTGSNPDFFSNTNRFDLGNYGNPNLYGNMGMDPTLKRRGY